MSNYQRVKQWRVNNPAKNAAQKRRHKLKKFYGISETEYNQMFNEQSGKCKICRNYSERKLDTDHDHVTGLVRGLLCISCNLAIGHMKDNPLIAKAAFEYLNGGVQ